MAETTNDTEALARAQARIEKMEAALRRIQKFISDWEHDPKYCFVDGGGCECYRGVFNSWIERALES